MAKGYPTPRERDEQFPNFAVPANACIICKKHRAVKNGMCASCDAILSAPT